MQQLWLTGSLICRAAALVVLVGMTPMDVREHRISGWPLVLLALNSSLEVLSGGGRDLTDLTALLPGVFLIGFGMLSGEKIGLGDGYLFLALGLSLDMSRVFGLCRDAFLMAALWSLWRRLPARGELPLVPCIALASAWDLILQLAAMRSG